MGLSQPLFVIYNRVSRREYIYRYIIRPHIRPGINPSAGLAIGRRTLLAFVVGAECVQKGPRS